VLLDENFEQVEQYCELIQPDGWQVPTDHFWIEHGYTTDKNQKHGVPMSHALKHFCNAVDRSNVLVAHNMSFDHPILSAEMKRYNVTPTRKPETKICTMKQTVDFCRIHKKSGTGFKYPRLNELHQKLFDIDFENAHDALSDVHATARCFVKLKKMKFF
jgi:DNA polymerase III epsilon subunit-like protein